QHDPAEGHAVDQLCELEDATLVSPREAAQIHQRGVAHRREAGDGEAPGVVVAEELVDPVAPVRIGAQVELAYPALEILSADHELPAQATAEEGQERGASARRASKGRGGGRVE